MSGTLRKAAVLAVLLMVPATLASAHSIAVLAGAAMNNTNFGLRVTIDGSATQAYVAAGPANGFSDECNLSGQFFVNPQNLTISSTPGQNFIRFMTFFDGFTGNSDVKLIYFLQKAAGNWFLTVWHWNEVINSWSFTGNGFLALADNPAWSENRVDWQYSCGNPGSLSMQRTLYTGGVPGATFDLLNVSVPNATGGEINWVFVGVVNPGSVLAGTSGDIDLDEFEFAR